MDIGAHKILSGFGWIALINYSNRILGFVTTLILAKLLSPSDFGLVAIASMVISILQIFKDMGLSEALIYRKDDINEASNTAFILMIVLNIIIFIMAVLVSPIASKYYENNLVMPVIILMSSNLIWNSISSVPFTLIRKSLDFNKLVMPSLIPVLLSSGVSIVMAYAGYGVWSLVTKTMIATILNMILIVKYAEFRPSFKYDFGIARDLLRYGKYIIGSSIMLVALYNVDKFYVSTYVGIAALGCFELAMSIANQLIVELSHLVGSVMFPVLSKMNKNYELFRKTFIRTIGYISKLTIPIAVGLFTFGPTLLNQLYGDAWLPMVFALQMLAFYAMFRSLSGTIYDALKAIGKPNVIQNFIFLRLIFIGVLGIPVIKIHGVNGLCILIVAIYAIMFVIELVVVSRVLLVNSLTLTKDIILTCLISTILITGGYKCIYVFIESPNLLQITAGIGIIVVIYIMTTLMINNVMREDIKTVLSGKHV